MSGKGFDENSVKIVRALNSDARRSLLRLAQDKPMTALEFHKKMETSEFYHSYKESTYKDLQMLVETGLVEKYRDGNSDILYRSRVDQIILDLDNMKVEIVYRESPV